MANLTENPVYESGVYQLETNDPVLGGTPVIVNGQPTDGHANVQAQQLANRTAYLKEQVDNIPLTVNLRVDEVFSGIVTQPDPFPQYALESTIGQPNGIASLDNNGQVPASQLLLAPSQVASASNTGEGAGVFSEKVDTDLKFKSLVAGTSITITEAEDVITISTSAGQAGGDVVGPSSSVNNSIALFDGVSGKSIKAGGVVGTAAYQNSTSFATSAQGAKADTAVQPSDLENKENILVAGTNITIDRTDPEAPVISASLENEGDVVGPSSSVTGEVALFNGTTGKLLQGGGVLGSAAFNNSEYFQAVLVSGTNIKTVNGNSLLGSGDISTAQVGPYSGVFIDNSLFASVSGTQTLNLSTDGTFDFTLTGNTTFSITGVPTLVGQQTIYIVVRIRQGATAYQPTWFSGITWLTSDGLAPSAPAANKVLEYIFTSADGVNWLGRKGAGN